MGRYVFIHTYVVRMVIITLAYNIYMKYSEYRHVRVYVVLHVNVLHTNVDLVTV